MTTGSIETPPIGDFISQLLSEQQAMTAAERFSNFHDQGAPAQLRENVYRELLPATPPTEHEQYAFEVDLDLCSGCKACVVACNTLNGLDPEETWRSVGTLSTIAPEPAKKSSVPSLDGIQHVTTACHHCADPGCLKGCPVKAYEKDAFTGIVRHLDDQCIGCKYCTMMCPYDVPQYNERLGIVRKCDMCHQRLSVGEAPACVQSCPNSAIKIRTVARDALSKTAVALDSDCVSVEGRLLPEAPLSSITGPTTQYLSRNPSRVHGLRAQNRSHDAPAESHWPLAVMLVMTQASWGLVVVSGAITLASAFAESASGQAYMRLSVGLAFLMAMAGMAIAPLHLGQPLRAWRVFMGFRTSWLSREAVMFGGYVGLLGIIFVQHWIPVLWTLGTSILPSAVGTGAALVAELGLIPLGGLGVFCSAMVYVATRRQLWSARRTCGRFFGTALFLGCAGAIPLVIATEGPRYLLVGLAGTVGLLGVVRWILWSSARRNALPESVSLQARADKLVHGPLRATDRYGRLALLSGVVSCWIAVGCSESVAQDVVISTAGLFLLTAGELAGRLIYFRSVVVDRMPGVL